MIESAMKILTQLNFYTIPLIAIICIYLLTFFSDQLKRAMRTPLLACTIVWAVFFGYKVYTGENLYTALTSPSQSDLEKARYKKVMIDGREVIYDEATGEIVKPSK